MPPTPEPISELAMTVQFTKIAGATVTDAADFVERFAADFPQIQQVHRLNPIDPNMFNVGTAAQIAVQMQMQLQGGLTPDDVSFPRLWLISEDSRRLVQFQNDRFGFNWRRLSPDDDHPYPGFVALRAEFAAAFDKFRVWYLERFEHPLLPTAGDLLYSNVMRLEDDNGRRRRISNVFRFYTPKKASPKTGFRVNWAEGIDVLGDPTEASLAVAAAIGALPDGKPVATFQMVSRFQLGEDDDMVQALDAAHDRSLEVFTDCVNNEAVFEVRP